MMRLCTAATCWLAAPLCAWWGCNEYCAACMQPPFQALLSGTTPWKLWPLPGQSVARPAPRDEQDRSFMLQVGLCTGCNSGMIRVGYLIMVP